MYKRNKLFWSGVSVALGVVSLAQAQTPTAVITCSSCTTLLGLQETANAWAHSYLPPNNTIVLVTSVTPYISGFEKIVYGPTAHGYAPHVSAITTTMAEAYALDSLVYSRHLKIPPIRNGALQYTDTDDDIEAYLDSQFTYQNNSGSSSPLGLVMPQYQWYQMKDEQTGQTVQIYVGEMIIFEYANGYSEKWKFIGVPAVGCRVGPGVPCMFERVPNTLMLNGKPVKPPSTAPAKPVTNFGSTGSVNTGDGSLSVWNSQQLCWGVSNITIYDPAGGNTYWDNYGVYAYPC